MRSLDTKHETQINHLDPQLWSLNVFVTTQQLGYCNFRFSEPKRFGSLENNIPVPKRPIPVDFNADFSQPVLVKNALQIRRNGLHQDLVLIFVNIEGDGLEFGVERVTPTLVERWSSRFLILLNQHALNSFCENNIGVIYVDANNMLGRYLFLTGITGSLSHSRIVLLAKILTAFTPFSTA